MGYQLSFSNAKDDFRRARRKANIRGILARITGAQFDLLSYEDIRKKLRAQSSIEKGLRDIPLDAIIGSVNRYADFTRDFLPRQGVSSDRWASIEIASVDLAGLPPIQVYQIGEAYFVLDGNHRVSVARQLGAKHIQAYVTEVYTRVVLSPKDSPDEIILKAEYVEFLEHTQLDITRPEIDLRVTAPGQYAVLEEHISVHRYLMNTQSQREVSLPDAAADWYERVYLPVRYVIGSKGLLNDFPGRTETDLYIWILLHSKALEDEIGHEISPTLAAHDLITRFSSRPGRRLARVKEKLRVGLIPDQVLGGPPAGEWRKERDISSENGNLFSNILVSINGKEQGWNALEEALIIAQREAANIQGIHVFGSSYRGKVEESPRGITIQDEFTHRCEGAGVPGKQLFIKGDVARSISAMAWWNDLTVVHVAYPPSPRPLDVLSSGIRTILQLCPTPVLIVPDRITPLSRPLLAYDGSPKAKEALFLAAYITGKWQVPLTVVSVFEPDQLDANSLDEAREYLEGCGVEAEYIHVNGPVAEAILIVTEEEGCDLLLMGGYGKTPLMKTVLGSNVDQIIRISHKPILICR